MTNSQKKSDSDKDIGELEKIFTMVATPIVLVDLPSEHILFLNHTAEELSGYVLEPEQPLSFLKLFSANYTKVISAIFELAKSQGQSFSVRENDIELRRKTGRPHPINLSASLMPWENRIFLVVTLEDLSEAKKNEKERQRLLGKAAHDAKLVDIGRLAAGMAHELNNPLAILMGYSESLETMITNNEYTDDLLQKNIVPVRKSAMRMSKIVSKMMAKIRNQPAKTEIQTLKQVVQETLIILEEIIAAHSIQLKVDVADQWVSCDSSQIEQIVTNIVMNAFHALEDRKTNREIRISSFEKASMTVLEVWNNGVPIPDKIQSQIFTPFFTTKNPGEGTGLGLYMSFNIMKSHSGELSFKSDATHGTSFYLSFPRVEKHTVKQQATKLKALIVDDDIFFRKMLCIKLHGFDVECCEARDGEDALSLLEQHAAAPFDLVIADNNMPKMNGVEFLSVAQVKYPHIHFSLISGASPLEDLVQKMKDLKIGEVLSKPLRSVDLTNLLDKVRETAHKKQAA